jgi:D-proline reductase (dithiol) PrdB
VGLIQRVIEEAGIPTVGISIVRKYTVETRAPRSVFLRWPMGHPLGEPFHLKQQTTVLKRALRALEEIDTPGTIIDLPYRWRRYEDLDIPG